MVSFIFIAFLVVKLKNLKCFAAMEHPWNVPFLSILGPNSPKYGPTLLKFAPQLLIKESKRLFQKIVENSNFYRNRTFPNFTFFLVFDQLWGQFSSWRRQKLKKLNTCKGKTTPWGYPKITKSRPYLIPIYQEKYDYFLYYFGHFLVKKGAWSHFKGLESKSHLPYCSVTTLGHISVQRVGPHHIPVLSLLVPKVVFFFNFKPLFQVWLLL